MKRALLILIAFFCLRIAALAQVTDTSKAPATISPQTNTNVNALELYPNNASKALMTPAGWSTNGNFVFAGIGATFPQVYTSRSDMIAVIGAGTGNASKALSVAAMLNINDVSRLRHYSASLIATHALPNGSTIGAGALHLFGGSWTDSPPSFYIRYSHTVQDLPSIIPGFSRLSYTIGAGTGRFLKKSRDDVRTGKGQYGTAVFGNLSYEVIRNVNLNLEWTGVNLCVTAGLRPLPQLPAISFGLADLTRYSGDRVRFVVGIGYAFYL
jgi:hypothetical protein